MKFAYFVRPHIGGTYTVFKQLREGLAGFGIEVRWLAMGEHESLGDPLWFSELEFGSVIETGGLHGERDQAQALASALADEGYDGVFINVLSDRVQTNIARYLPETILRIMIVHNITPGTYAAAAAIRDHVHATIGVSERCRKDLVERYGFAPAHTHVIPNAIDTEVFRGKMREARQETRLRMLFLGRIEDASKGVFWLPGIMERLPRSAALTVAGAGPDLEKLRKDMAPHASRIEFLGAVPPAQIPALLLRHDVLVMPSRFEGYPLT
ncbi:MAG: glycosyltransferase family 4 protein, partial [Phyllobacterium sp.]